MKIEHTTDYKKFKLMKGNREISHEHMTKIARSIKQMNLTEVRPIIVNSNWEIIDGQHSFMACKELGLPIHYIKANGLGLEAVHLLNSSMSNWTGEDFLNMWAKKGNKNYIALQDFIARWRLNLSDSISIMKGYVAGGGHGNSRNKRDFQDGAFVVKDVDYANACAGALYDFSKYCEGFRSRSFVIMFTRVYPLKSYNHKRMIDQLKAWGKTIDKQPTWRQYLEIISDIYDEGLDDKKELKFQIKGYLQPQSQVTRKR